MTWLFGSSKKELPPISDPVPLASQSDIGPSNTKSLAALRQERIATGLPIIQKPKAPGRLIGGFNRFVAAFQRLNQPPARPPQNIYKPKHGSHHRHHYKDGSHHRHHHKGGSHHRRHHKDGSGPEKKVSKHHHHREHRWQREERLKREAEEKARKGKHASSSSSPGLQAPKPVHVRRAQDPLPDMSPLSRQIRDIEGMVPSTHQGPGNHGRAVPEALNSSAGKGKQRAGEAALCRLCSKRSEYRPGNGLCDKCMQLAFEPERNRAEVGGGRSAEDLRLPFSSPTGSKQYYAGEFDPSDPKSIHPSYRAESQAYAYVKGQDGRRERDKSTARNENMENDKGKGKDKYEPIAWRQKLGTGKEKASEKPKVPEHLTYSRDTIRNNGSSLLEQSPFNPPSPSTPLAAENLARHTSARPSAPPSIWTDVKCTDIDPPARRRRSSSPPIPDHRNPTVAASTSAYNALHRFRSELKPTPSLSPARNDDDEHSGDLSHTGYTTIINAYARDNTATAPSTLHTKRPKHYSPPSPSNRYSPPSPSIYPSAIAPRSRPTTAAAPPSVFDDRDARRNFDPLHPGFFDSGANPWFNEREEGKTQARREAAENPKAQPKAQPNDNANPKPSQGHYTDRHGQTHHLAPAHPPKGPAPALPAGFKPLPRDAPFARQAPAAPAAVRPAARPAADQDRERKRERERDAGRRVTDLGEFTAGKKGEGEGGWRGWWGGKG